MERKQISTDSAEYRSFIEELQECVDGYRGWVSLTNKRAEGWGLNISSLTDPAKRMGLKIKKHGRYGRIATR